MPRGGKNNQQPSELCLNESEMHTPPKTPEYITWRGPWFSVWAKGCFHALLQRLQHLSEGTRVQLAMFRSAERRPDPASTESVALAPRIPRSTGHALESIDFDLYESASESGKPTACGITAKWIAVLMIGLATGLVASGIDYGIELLTRFRFGAMEDLVKQGTPQSLLMVIHVLLCTTFASVAGALVCFVSPLAAGSGIPEVKCRLNGIDLPLVVKPRTLLAKACGVLFSVSAGLPCGKEGPMIHSGAILGALFSRCLPVGPSNLRDIELRDMITAGGAAGLLHSTGF